MLFPKNRLARYPTIVLFLLLGACSARARPSSESPVGCYHFDRPISYSATGEREAGDSAWYVIRLLPDGRVERPSFVAARRERFARRSSWHKSGDTLHIRVFDGLVGWDLKLRSVEREYRGIGTYLSDAIVLGRPPFEAPFAANERQCVAAP